MYSISTNIPSLAKSFSNLSQPQCCGGRWLKAESKYVYGMQWKMSSKSSAHQNSKVPRNCANQTDANGFSTPIVSQIAAWSVSSASSTWSIVRTASLPLFYSLSLSYSLFYLLPCLFLLSLPWYRTHLYSVCFRALQIQLNKQFGSRSLHAQLATLFLLFTFFARN